MGELPLRARLVLLTAHEHSLRSVPLFVICRVSRYSATLFDTLSKSSLKGNIKRAGSVDWGRFKAVVGPLHFGAIPKLEYATYVVGQVLADISTHNFYRFVITYRVVPRVVQVAENSVVEELSDNSDSTWVLKIVS
jgi:hypothetical protein